MRHAALTLAILTATPAYALTEPMGGTWLDLGASPALVGSDLSAGAQLSAGWWWGPYDPSYALGRFHGLGLSATFLPGDHPYLNAGMEYRHGKDVIVLGWYSGVVLGAEQRGDALGAHAMVEAGVRWRLKPHYALQARFTGGAGTAEGIHGIAGLNLGLTWTRPWTKPATEPE